MALSIEMQKPNKIGSLPTRVVLDSDIFDTIIKCHLQLVHAGATKTFAYIQEQFHGIGCGEVD